MVVRYNAKNDPYKRAPYTDGKEYNAAEYIPGHYDGDYYVEGYYLLMENDNRVFDKPMPINEFLFDHINDDFISRELSATGANPFIPGFSSRNLYKQFAAHGAKYDGDPKNAPRWDEGELSLAEGERVIVCPKCGDAHCYSGPAYDQCDVCGYVDGHGAYACACCGAMALANCGYCEICPICGWQEDSVQNDDPDYAGGANWLSLNRAKENWKEHGVIMTEKDKQERKEFYQAHIAPDGTWIHDK
jgi:hypothetical protein